MDKITEQAIIAFQSIALSQDEKGLNKYGMTLEQREISERDWSTDVKEELVDAFKYIVMLEKERNYYKSRFEQLETIILQKGIAIEDY